MPKLEKRVLRRSLTVVGDLFSSTVDAIKNERDVKMALYNSLAFLFVLLCILSFCSVYFILQPFLKSLLWALLCGSALHPFKERLSEKLRSEIGFLESSERPFSISVLLVPFYTVDWISNIFGKILKHNIYLIVKCSLFVFLAGLFYFYTPSVIFTIFNSTWECIHLTLLFILSAFNSTIITGSVVVSFCVALFTLWGQEYDFILSVLSFISWISGTAWLSNFFPSLRVFLFVFFNLVLVVSFLYRLYESFLEKTSKPDEKECKLSETIEDEKYIQTSSLYIKHLTAACAFLFAVSIPSVFYFVMAFVVINGVKILWFKISDSYNIERYIQNVKCKFHQLFIQRENVLFPPTLKILLKGWRKVKFKLLTCVKDYCSCAATTIVILLLLASVLFFIVFLAIQVYKEGIFLVQASGNIINSTILHNPQLNEIIPDDWRVKIDDLLNDAYIYIREGIATMLQSFMKKKGIDPLRSKQLEYEALQLWDRAYQAWVPPFQTTTGPITVMVTPDAVSLAYHQFFEQLKKTPEIFTWDLSLIKDNMSTLKTGLDSILPIVWGNMSLFTNIALTMFLLIFGGGISILNFFLNWVVFLTALFYLLNSSQEVYKPVEIITQMFPKHGKRLALAVELSCQEVLTASFKLSTFYGLWTWLVHTVFMSHLAYTPAIFAAVLGMVPVLGTYWVCLPAVLDIWLIQESELRAVGLFIVQIIPTTVVEMTVYNEIKGGGHPYLTGLSVAGGIFWLGVEGVIVGPVVLCIVFTFLKMLTNGTNPNL
ncbi:transmembrane protein 245-like [Cimex lectularius]|uniref:Transmembrane protein 245 n=1 Tax=Cimex lectularius TaxID=79782 RepID=A0A8I6SAB7_CIMLE|nr:transmembrane protein 245-like [Cimex lectularius]